MWDSFFNLAKNFPIFIALTSLAFIIASSIGQFFGKLLTNALFLPGEGYNRVFVDCDPSAHGEVVAIRNAGKNLGTFELTGCSLYTNFEPCPMCGASKQILNSFDFKGALALADIGISTVLGMCSTVLLE